MSKINKIAESYGVDKTLHFLVGALVVAVGNQINWIVGISAIVLIIALEIYKEYKLDDFVDWADVRATFKGAMYSEVVSVIIIVAKHFLF